MCSFPRYLYILSNSKAITRRKTARLRVDTLSKEKNKIIEIIYKITNDKRRQNGRIEALRTLPPEQIENKHQFM